MALAFFAAALIAVALLPIAGAFLLSSIALAREGFEGAGLRPIAGLGDFATGFKAFAVAFAAEVAFAAGVASLRCTVFFATAALALAGVLVWVAVLGFLEAAGLGAGALPPADFLSLFLLTCLLIRILTFAHAVNN